MRDQNDKRSTKKTRGQCGESRKHVLSVRLPRDFVEMLERAGRQYVLPAKSRCLPVKWLGCFSNRKWSGNQNIAEIIRRMEAARRARRK